MTEPIVPGPISTRRMAVPAPVLRRLVTALESNVGARAPLTLQLLGRFLLHAAAVGAAVGAVSVLFVEGVELVQYIMLERVAGYVPLRAAGEGPAMPHEGVTFRPVSYTHLTLPTKA